jgi:uncharacterized NAD(P)/FAD-binding protein YdhS
MVEVGEQTATILVGIIGAIGAVLAASIPYYLTKRNEMTLNIQKIKLKRYDDLLQKFVKWLQSQKEGDPDEEEKTATSEFIMAYQRASSYASKMVLDAVAAYIRAYMSPVSKSSTTDPTMIAARVEEHRLLCRM